MTNESAIVVGRYTLFGRIGVGGMATVHLGQLSGASGFKRIVAIKRLHPHIAKMPDLAGMLIDEARLASRITHPNVVQVLDLVQSGDELLIVMEYLRGASLAALLRAHRGRGHIPLPIVSAITLQVLAGLHAAHEARDEGGAPLGLVHRDVSPENVFVGIDGVVRVLDFGIAKAQGRVQDTGDGVIKGKLAYVPPEQLTGNVTRRTDVYATAAVLWEMLAARRMIESASNVEAMMLVVRGSFEPPSTHNAAVPPALDAIVARALSRAPEDRFATASDMATALARVCAPAQPAEVAAWVSSVAATSLRERDLEISAIESAMLTVPDIGMRTPTPTARTHGLGADPTSFLGRQADLTALFELFRTERVVTLLGPGGIGKTRLSRRYAMLRAHDFTGIWFCDLTECATVEDVCLVVAGALDVPLGKQETPAIVSGIGRAIEAKGNVLLVIDNCEQAVSAIAHVIDQWSRAALHARFLCTSRERLRIDAERVYELPPLAEAVQLFVERAQRARASYELGDDGAIVEEIVRRLDGMPLAIELAAARMSVLDPKSLLLRLEATGIKMLTTGVRTSSERQSSLRSAIEWSWSLLEPWEKRALAQLAVFRGGFWLAAAERVVDLAGELLGVPETMDVVQSLVEKSLLRAFELPGFKGEMRFGMYESIREFALGKLGENQASAILDRHTQYFLDLWSSWDTVNWYGVVPEVHRLALERDNLLAAHTRARLLGSEDVLRAQIALFPLFATRGPHAMYMTFVDVARDDAIAADPRLRARHLLVRGRAEQLVGLRQEAMRDFERARAMASELANAGLAARALVYLGTAKRADGDLDAARSRYREALVLFVQAADRRAAGVVLSALAALDLAQQRLESARDLIDQAIATSRELGDRATVGIMLIDAGVIRQELGDLPSAMVAYEEAIGLLDELGYLRHAFIARGYRASLAFERDELEEARDRYAEALDGMRKVGDTKWMGVLAAALGASLARLGDIENAEARFAEAEGHTGLEPRYVATIALLRGQLDVVRGDAARARERISLAGDLLHTSDDVRFAARVLLRALDRCK